MLRRDSKKGSAGPQPQDEKGWVEEEIRILQCGLEEAALTIFRVDLGRRLVERIMTDGLMTSVYDWYEDLQRVHKILSDVDSHLRSVRSGATQDVQDLQAAAEKAGLGSTGEQRRGGSRRRR